MLRAQISAAELKSAYAVHCPLRYEPRTPLHARLIFAGLQDGIVPPAQAQTLWEHWRKPRIHWLSGGHFGQIVEPNTLRQVHEFLLELGLAHSRPLEIREAKRTGERHTP
jgi:pimeloyl-ACP methyl ester carboxylesterase